MNKANLIFNKLAYQDPYLRERLKNRIVIAPALNAAIGAAGGAVAGAMLTKQTSKLFKANVPNKARYPMIGAALGGVLLGAMSALEERDNLKILNGQGSRNNK